MIVQERFSDFRKSMLTLATVFVSDAWTDLMWEGASAGCVSTQSQNDDPAEVKALPICGQSEITEPIGASFFVIFFFVCQFVLVALFVAVILEKTQGVTLEDSDMELTHMESMVETVWTSLKGFVEWILNRLRPKKRSNSTLYVSIIEAQDLLTSSMDEALCDSFCRVRVGRQCRQTSVYPDAFSPSWEMSAPFRFNLADAKVLQDTVQFEVLNQHISDMYEQLGLAELKLADLRVDSTVVTTDEEKAAGISAWETDHWFSLQREIRDDSSVKDAAILPPALQHMNDILHAAAHGHHSDAQTMPSGTRYAAPPPSNLGLGRLHVRMRLEILAVPDEKASIISAFGKSSEKNTIDHGGQGEAVTISGQQMGMFTKTSAEHHSDDESSVSSDDSITAPYRLHHAKHPSGCAGVRSRISDLGARILKSTLYRPVLYSVILLDAALMILSENRESQLYLNPALRLLTMTVVDLVFWFEFLVKASTFGMFGNSCTRIWTLDEGHHVLRVVDPYFAQRWNMLDFLCLLSTLKTLFDFFEIGNLSLPPQLLKSLALLRCLRPLRLVTRSQSMRELVGSLLRAGKSVVNVVFFITNVYIIFAVVGNGLFGGKFHRCSDPSILDWPRTTIELETDKAKCLGVFQIHADVSPGFDFLRPRAWWKPAYGFDNIYEAIITLVKVGSLKWLKIANDAMSVTDFNMQPVPESSYDSAIFFVVFILFGSYFCISLFVAVIIDSFFQAADGQGDGHAIEWLSMHRLIMRANPRMSAPEPPWNNISAAARRLLQSKHVDAFNLLFVLGNFIFLVCNNADPSHAFLFSFYLW